MNQSILSSLALGVLLCVCGCESKVADEGDGLRTVRLHFEGFKKSNSGAT